MLQKNENVLGANEEEQPLSASAISAYQKRAVPQDRPGKPKKRPFQDAARRLRLILFSSLTKRIVFLNMAALTVLLSTILYMNQFREGLIDAKLESLRTQGDIIAGAIAGSATSNQDAITIDPDQLLELKAGEGLLPPLDPLDDFSYPINPEQVAPVLRALIKPTQTRARIYDPDGIPILDSRNLYAGGQIIRLDVPGVGDEAEVERIWSSRFLGKILNQLLQSEELPIYRDLYGLGTQYPEVQTAMAGGTESVVRQTPKGKLTVSVAVPIQRYQVVLGVLLLSTEGDDIDRVVREERLEILRVFLVAAIITFVLSALLASTIATPLGKLSDAAKRVKRGVKSRVEIPDFTARQDEVGELSKSISEMTESLYQRIEAIERFAADVSHELKNPLTSLRSAVETLPLAKNETSRQRLMDVIQHDVKRLDRLITDISDASRLDADLVREKTDCLDFAALLENIVNASREVRRGKKSAKINLEINRTSTKAGYWVLGHDTRLGQVINNLIDNAISFVPDIGGVVDLKLGRDGGFVEFKVEDNGPGIAAEDVNRIFERFYTDRPESEGFGQNSGLGLSISKQIIEAHGGTISARNKSGDETGACFTVRIPLEMKRK